MSSRAVYAENSFEKNIFPCFTNISLFPNSNRFHQRLVTESLFTVKLPMNERGRKILTYKDENRKQLFIASKAFLLLDIGKWRIVVSSYEGSIKKLQGKYLYLFLRDVLSDRKSRDPS